MATPIKRGKTYVYGVLLKDTDVMNPAFRFKESVLPGDVLVDSGIETWEQFWLENPRNEKRPQPHTVYELVQSKNTRTLKYVAEGMFTMPGTYKKRIAMETLSDAADAHTSEEPTPLAAYAAVATPKINLPEINELIQQTLASQNDFATEQISLLRSIIADKDKYIESIQKNEATKIDMAVLMYTERIKQLEARVAELTTENTRLTSENAVLKSNVEKLEWQTKEAKKIEEKLQRDFDEATKVMSKGLADGGGSGILDKLLDRPLDEVVRGISLLKEMFTGNSPAQQSAYTQEQLQQLYQQAARYQASSVPGVPQNGMPQNVAPQNVEPQNGTPQNSMPQNVMPQNAMPLQGAATGARPTTPPVPLQTGTQLENGTPTKPQFANVQSM